MQSCKTREVAVPFSYVNKKVTHFTVCLIHTLWGVCCNYVGEAIEWGGVTDFRGVAYMVVVYVVALR